MKSLLIKLLEKHIGVVSHNALQVLSNCTESYEVNQHTNIIHWLEDQDILFVENGALKFTEISEEAKVNLHLLTEGMFFLNLSESDQLPASTFQLTTAKPSTIAIIRHLKINDRQLGNHEVNRIYASILGEIVMREKEWKSMIMLRSTKEKYKQMELHHCSILQSFQTKDVANFLGVTAGTINKAKRKKS